MSQNSLINKLNTYYKEWKEYDTFYERSLPEVFKEVKEDIHKIVASEDSKAAENFFIKTNFYPKLYAADLQNLALKFLLVYDVLKDEIEVPEDIKKDAEKIKDIKFDIRFVIENGKPKEVDKEKIEQILNNFKSMMSEEKMMEYIKNIKT